jgi:hypothetical protein
MALASRSTYLRREIGIRQAILYFRQRQLISDAHVYKHGQIRNRVNRAAIGRGPGPQALEQLLSAAILCVGAWLAMGSPDFTIGMLVAFQMFAARVAQPLDRRLQAHRPEVAVHAVAEAHRAGRLVPRAADDHHRDQFQLGRADLGPELFRREIDADPEANGTMCARPAVRPAVIGR